MNERLDDVRKERDRQKRHDASAQNVSPSAIKYPGDSLIRVATSIKLPLIRENGSRPTQVLLQSGLGESELDTALNNVDELKVFLERYYWAIGEIILTLRLEEDWTSHAVLTGLWSCTRMFASLDRVSCSFSVNCLGRNSEVLGAEGISELEAGLQKWIGHMYEELRQDEANR